MSDREQFEAARAAGLKARHETRVERAIRRQVAEEIAQALETDRDHGDGLPISDTVSRYQAWTYAAALAREIGAKETS